MPETARRCTYGEIATWEGRYELYDGVPVALAAPSRTHQRISGELFAQFHAFLRERRCCEVYAAPFDVRLFDTAADRPEQSVTVVQPDLIIVCDPDRLDEQGVRGAPDLVAEILSPATKSNDRLRKYRLYERAGVREYWIVDPDTRSVAVHTLTGDAYGSPAFYLAGSDVPVGILDGCTIDLSAVFPA